MSDDWESVTRIGQSRGGAGGGIPRQKVVKGNSALNAAMRTGGVSSEKKSKSKIQGQRDAKVDRDPDITPPLKADRDFKGVMGRARKEKGNLTQADLARLSGVTLKVIQNLEAGKAVPDQETLGKIEAGLGVFLSKSKFGEPKGFEAKKRAKAAAEKKAKEAAEVKAKEAAEAEAKEAAEEKVEEAAEDQGKEDE